MSMDIFSSFPCGTGWESLGVSQGLVTPSAVGLEKGCGCPVMGQNCFGVGFPDSQVLNGSAADSLDLLPVFYLDAWR